MRNKLRSSVVDLLLVLIMVSGVTPWKSIAARFSSNTCGSLP